MFFSRFPPTLVLIVMRQLYLFCFEIIVAHSDEVLYVFPFLLLGVSVVNSWISKMVYFGFELSTTFTHTKQRCYFAQAGGLLKSVRRMQIRLQNEVTGKHFTATLLSG